MTFIAPALHADAADRLMPRTCAPTASSPTPATYTVAEGDAWFAVAIATGVSAGALLAANDADASTVLYPGDVLCLPVGVPGSAPTSEGASCASKYNVVSGDSWFRISRSADVSLASLLDANDANADTLLQAGAEICLPVGAAAPAPSGPACASKHTVLVGESWAGIAMSAGLRTTALLDANNATSTTVLHPGDELCLPPGAAPLVTANPCVSKRTVAAGESWYVISRSSGVPIEALYAANDASASSALHPGQSLCLPEVGFGRGLRSTLLEAAPLRGACRFANSWMASRGDRLHVGVDLISPAGTSVVAAASGTLTRQTQGAPRSGNAWWLTTPSGTYFFYAHLSGFENGLTVGSRVRAGDVIGYVGSTGNAVSPHLHFEIHPHGGGPINPYDSIWTVGGCRYDRRYEQAPLS